MRAIGAEDRSGTRPVVVAQFGEGNFLRAFVDYMIDAANRQGMFDGGVAVIKPIPFGSLERFQAQDSVYTVLLRGRQNGEDVVERQVVSAISRLVDPFADYQDFLELARCETLRFVVSNTTEAGIAYDGTDRFDRQPANSFPGKLTQFLYARFQHFAGDPAKGLIMLPVELIDANGKKLRECVAGLIELWQLPAAFAAWVREACIFCSTLVDRIVSGYPAGEAKELEASLGYRDELLVVGEPFGLWVIESDRSEQVRREFPLDKAGQPVVFTGDQRPYRERKVRVLNGAHTATVLGAYLAGLDTVGQCMADPTVRAFLEQAVYGEILPTVPLPAGEVKAFADSVMERFENPFIRHELLSIALNSVSKWRTRVLPSLKDSLAATGELPPCLSASLAALAAFYRTAQRGDGCLIGRRGEATYEIRDDGEVLDFFAAHAGLPNGAFAQALLARTDFWGEDLTRLDGLCGRVGECLDIIEAEGAAALFRSVTGG